MSKAETHKPTAYKLLAQSLDVTASSNTVEDEFEKFINGTPH